MTNPLLQLMQCGQIYWLDDLTRGMITSGELQQRVTEQGLRGITSNPSTFHKAISDSQDYDTQIERLVNEGYDATQIYEHLAVTDIQEACGILQPVYTGSDGTDGFVSLEVSPHLAHDAEATMHEVRRLSKAVDRPNVFIKIPGTPAGLPAIEEMLYEGINVNITLLFAIKDYEAVAHAYMRALERRVAENLPIRNVASVASFFLSRIDVLVDELLSHRLHASGSKGDGRRADQLLGQTAIANAKLAYQSFKHIFAGDRWQALTAEGARVQRPLWASTSTKNPEYRDVRYIEPLIGPHTVTTMPADTIAAFADHGVVELTVEANLNQAHQSLRDLESVGINLDYVTQRLQDEGVQKFIDPYDALMDALATKCGAPQVAHRN
jgi:transaldolase